MRISDGGGSIFVSAGTGKFCFAGDAGAKKLGLHDVSQSESVLNHQLNGDIPTIAATAHDAGKAAFGTRSGAIFVWDVQFPTVLESFLSGESESAEGVGTTKDPISVIAWHPRGYALAAGTSKGALTVWDMVLGAPAFRIDTAHAGGITGVSWTAHGRALVTSGFDGELRVWNVRHARIDAAIDGTKASDMWHDGPISALDTIEDLSRVALSGAADGSAFLSVLKPGERDGCGVFCRLPSHEGSVTAARFAPLSSTAPLRAATGGADASVRVFDMERRLPMATFQHARGESIRQIEFAPDGNAAFSAAGKAVVAWDTRVSEDELPGVRFEADAKVTGFCIADDAKSIILGCEDGLLRMFDVRYPSGGVADDELKAGK